MLPMSLSPLVSFTVDCSPENSPLSRKMAAFGLILSQVSVLLLEHPHNSTTCPAVNSSLTLPESQFTPRDVDLMGFAGTTWALSG